MSNEIIKVLEYLGEKCGIAIDWTQQNVLPYVQDLAGRFAKYYIVESIIILVMLTVLGIIGTVCGVIVIKAAYEASQYNENECNTLWEMNSYGMEPTGFGWGFIVTSIVGVLVGYIGTPVMVAELVKWIIIPEFQMIEEISYLMQTL